MSLGITYTRTLFYLLATKAHLYDDMHAEQSD